MLLCTIKTMTSWYLQIDFRFSMPQGIEMIHDVSHSNLHFRPFLFHPISRALYGLKVRYRLQPAMRVIEKTPAGAFASTEFSSRIARLCRAQVGVSGWPAASKRDEPSCAPECHYAARFPALIKWRAKCARHRPTLFWISEKPLCMLRRMNRKPETRAILHAQCGSTYYASSSVHAWISNMTPYYSEGFLSPRSFSR